MRFPLRCIPARAFRSRWCAKAGSNSATAAARAADAKNSCRSIARHAKLMVLFGGANPKNTQVIKGGCASHTTGKWNEQIARAGVEVVNVSPIRDDGPESVRPEWIAIRPNTDTAMLLALV